MTQPRYSTKSPPPPRTVLADRFWRDLFVHGREAVLPHIGNYFAVSSAKLTKRRRKPSIATLVKRAEKAGKAVTSITTPDGTTLTFGESESVADNEVENWFRKQRRHADQR